MCVWGVLYEWTYKLCVHVCVHAMTTADLYYSGSPSYWLKIYQQNHYKCSNKSLSSGLQSSPFYKNSLSCTRHGRICHTPVWNHYHNETFLKHIYHFHHCLCCIQTHAPTFLQQLFLLRVTFCVHGLRMLSDQLFVTSMYWAVLWFANIH